MQEEEDQKTLVGTHISNKDIHQELSSLRKVVNRHSRMLTHIYSIYDKISSPPLTPHNSPQNSQGKSSPISMCHSPKLNIGLDLSKLDSPKTQRIKHLNDKNSALESHIQALESLIKVYELLPPEKE